MEIRASYMLVGVVVLAMITGLAAFSVWLVKADVDRQAKVYEIYFEGSVTGLQEGSQVRYRGVPVGRIVSIGIDPSNVERVRSVAEIDHDTPITRDTIATLEMQGITGIAYVQLQGGTRDSPPLVADDDDETVPVITAERSALEKVFESTPDLLARAVQVADRISGLLNDDNVEALSETLENLRSFSGSLASNADEIGGMTSGVTETLAEIRGATSDLGELTRDLMGLAGKLDQGFEGEGGDLVETLNELSGAANALGGAATQLDGAVGDLREPLSDFSGTGLYELTNLVGESRALVAALSRIVKEVERDPTGFLIGGGRQGFEAE
jgi:phospholipid/cholesterol/gamma-HCH transport system substrate-binding protein